LSAHVVVEDLSKWAKLLGEMRLLLQRFNINHITLQPEISAEIPPANYASVIPIRPEKI
jgi:Co/Zn/Cd efflux system component